MKLKLCGEIRILFNMFNRMVIHFQLHLKCLIIKDQLLKIHMNCVLCSMSSHQSSNIITNQSLNQTLVEKSLNDSGSSFGSSSLR